MAFERPKLATTPLAGYRPLGVRGEPVYRSHAQLVSVIEARLGKQYADLFSIPQTHERGDKIDWYASCDGQVVNWNEADAETRLLIVDKIDTLLPEILQVSDSLSENDRGGAGALLAQIINQAVNVPDERYVYLVGDQPVVTFWGMCPSDSEEPVSVLPKLREMLSEPVAAPEPPPKPVASGPTFWSRLFGASFLGFLWRLIWLLLLLALLYLGLRYLRAPSPPPPEPAAVAPAPALENVHLPADGSDLSLLG